MKKKNMIFHIPNHIDLSRHSGSQLRPVKMWKAFETIGYHVDVVMGYGEERKQQIAEIRKKILDGVTYDFLYSESSTMPCLLTEKDHFPRYPHLDYGFFSFCKKHGIRIGLFYRDIYWKFPAYKKSVKWYQRMASVPMYHYDLRQYKKLVDMLYLPSMGMRDYVGLDMAIRELPPGCDAQADWALAKKSPAPGQLRLFYVGGVGGLYDLTMLLAAVKQTPGISLTVCCRKEEWEAQKAHYLPYIGENIHIIHKGTQELSPYYREADIAMLFFPGEEYRDFAMPIKLFEYLGNAVPILATEKTAAGKFVREQDIGWAIPDTEQALREKLTELLADPEQVGKKIQNMARVFGQHTWEARAKTVASDLSGDRG